MFLLLIVYPSYFEDYDFWKTYFTIWLVLGRNIQKSEKPVLYIDFGFEHDKSVCKNLTKKVREIKR